jgi:hypothetical protein
MLMMTIIIIIIIIISNVLSSTLGKEPGCLNNYLTPRSGVLLQKLAVPQLVQKFPVYYGTRRFITAFPRPRPFFLS